MSSTALGRSALFLLGTALGTPAFSQAFPAAANQELVREQQREDARRKLAQVQPDVRLQRPPAPLAGYPEREAPCFVIDRVTLAGDLADDFQWALKAAEPAIGRCLGSAGLNVLTGQIQNALIARGYVTSRVVAPPQDLLGGTLALRLVPGRIRAIRFAGAEPGGVDGALPARAGGLLNLRDIEQGLENFKRVPGARADIQIVPGEQAGESDLLIKWQGGRAWRFSLSADDSGSDATGAYQGAATASIDNPTGRHDLLYATYSHDLPAGGGSGQHGTGGHALHYSLPWGYWLASLQFNDYRYRQTIAGATQDYLYRGTSVNSEFKLARLVYRDAVRKTTLALRAYQRRSRNYIDDTEVQVQRRSMGGFALAVSHKEFIGSSTLDATLAWKRGTGAFGTLAAPEELYGEGTSRPRLINADASLAVPLSRQFAWQSAWRAQWNRSTLVPQDRFAIGGRYTVRGFDGESSLSAERGWLLRNDLVWTVPGSRQQLYLALDRAVVSGPSAPLLSGRALTGAAIGWRGQLGRLQADVFAGKPLRKPAAFRTAGAATGFNLNYEF